MRIPLFEPTAPKFISINPTNNLVHLLVPLVGGQRISTDNTCQATKSLTNFFEHSGADMSLKACKSALELDLQLLPQDHPLTAAKQDRLAQINAYIEALPNLMQDGSTVVVNGEEKIRRKYTDAVNKLMETASNLYSIQLRPRAQDPYSLVVNPVFNINRKNDATGTPLSALYNAIHAAFPSVTLARLEPRAQLNKATSAALPKDASFTDIQRTLTDQCQRLFGLEINFTHDSDGMLIDQGSLNEMITGNRNESLTHQDYIDVLLGKCALNIENDISGSPFNKVQDDESKAETLSILTQFFLAQVNIHCKANKISDLNFGQILDASPVLSNEVVATIGSALSDGSSVEESLHTFINNHATEFGLSRSLAPEEMSSIKLKFEQNYATVTGTKENPHMDDFMILDATHDGKCVTHQASICTDFTELLTPELDNDYFKRVRADFETPSERIIPHKHEHVAESIEMSVSELLLHINEDALNKLPLKIRLECMKDPAFHAYTFLHNVAKGKQDETKQFLIDNPRAQELLRTPGQFTDYSGRTFNCTAYEYAYWAKDTHMQRMLEGQMDDQTAAEMLVRINEMERIDPITEKPIGLEYQQNGTVHRSAHFDFTPFREALEKYVENIDDWVKTEAINYAEAAWMVVGKAQRDVPAHVAKEYCRKDRPFHPLPEFNEDVLPEGMTAYTNETDSYDSWFPLTTSRLGINFAFSRGDQEEWLQGNMEWRGASAYSAVISATADLRAINRLDEVRTADLEQSRNNLKPVEVNVSELMTHITEEELEKLPHKVLLKCMKDPTFQANTFLHHVAKGKQDQAKRILKANPNTQELLRTPGQFTDYSGRTFNCTAYEYAYWAKDTHMQRMLELQMDDETKAELLTRIDEMERTGLGYTQNGIEHRSVHFDFTPLIEALEQYNENYNFDSNNSEDISEEMMAAMEAALKKVGLAQRDVPAHVAKEYCMKDRPFYPTPEFNEDVLPQSMTFFNYTNFSYGSWFPLATSTGELGVNFALIRGSNEQWDGWQGPREGLRGVSVVLNCSADLVAVKRLDEVRTADLTLSRNNLKPLDLEHSSSLTH